MRFVGEPIAAVVAPHPGGGRGHRRSGRGRDRARRRRWSMRRRRWRPALPRVHGEAAANVIVEGRVKTAGFDATMAAAHRRIKLDIRSRRQNALPLEPRAAHAAWDPASQRVTLHCATQTPHAHAHHHRRADRHAGERPARDRARCRRRLRAEDVAGARVRGGDLARAQAQDARSPGRRTGARTSSPASTAATSTSRSKAPSTPTPGCSRCPRTFSPMSAPIRAIRPPAGSSR